MSDIRRIAGIAGILFIVLTIASFLLPGAPPQMNDSNSEILKYLEDGRTSILVGQWLLFVGIVPGVIFYGYFVSQLREAEGAPGPLSIAALASILVALIMGEVVAAAFGGGAYGATHGLTEDSARLLWNLLAVGISAQVSALGAFGLTSGWVIVAKGGLPKWLGWIGVISGVIGVAASPMLAWDGAFTPTSGLSVLPFLALTIYVVAVSVMFLRSEQ